MYHVALDQFSGPLQLLLELIEGEKLPIAEVSLARVTEGYLKHLDANDVPAEELADFLVVATKLLLIKSRAILPELVADEEDDGSRLAEQLRMYKQFVDASVKIEAMYGAGRVMFARGKAAAAPSAPSFSPPPSVTPSAMEESFRALLKRLEPFFALKRTSMERVVSVQERMKELQDAIVSRSRFLFADVVGKASSKVDVVVSFLALLELMKQRVVRVVQSDSFHDIVISHVD